MSDYEMDFDIEGSPKHQMLDQSISEASFKSIEVEEEVKGSKESNQQASEQFVEEELPDELPSKDSKSVKSSVAKESQRKERESKAEQMSQKAPPSIEKEIEQVPVAVELKSFKDGEDSEPKKPEVDKENVVPLVISQKEPVASAVGSSRTNVQTSQSSKRQQNVPNQRPKFVQKPIVQRPPQQLAHGKTRVGAAPIPAERKMQLRTTVTAKRPQQTSQLGQQKMTEGRSQVGLRTTNDFRAQSVKRPETGNQRNLRPFTANMQKNAGLQRNSSRKPAEAYGNQFQEPRRSKASLSTKRMTQSIRETSSRMVQSSNAKERPVRQLKMADYYKEQRKSLNGSARFNSNSFQKQQQNPQPMKPVSHSFASDLLEKIIDQEAKQNNGFTLFRRGEELKSALIDKSKVCEYIDSLAPSSDVRQRMPFEDPTALNMFDKPAETSVISGTKGSSKKSKKPKALDLDEHGKDWGDVMSYFKNNPSALLDAIPTPREEQKNESRNFVFTREPGTPLKSVRSLQAGTPRSTQRSPKTFGFSATKRPVSRGLNTSSSRASLKSNSSQKRLNMSFQKPKVGDIGYKRQEYGLQSPGHSAKYQNIRSSGYGVSKIANITSSGSIRHLNQQETPKKQDFRINRKLQSAKQAVGNIAAAMVRQKRIAAQSVHRVKANETKKRTEVIKANLKKNQNVRPATTNSESIFQNDGTSSRVRSKLALQPQLSQDWKESTLYKEYILADNQPLIIFDQTSQMFRIDEVEYLLNMFSQKRLSEDLQKLYEPNTKKGLQTCEFILREVLGEKSFNFEYDQMAIELGGTQKSQVEARIACETTLKFCRALFQLRAQVLETLRSVKEREVVLYIMKARVMNIQNELDIGDSEDEQSRDTRKELTQVGAELVKATRKALESVQNLLQAQNRLMRHVKVDKFVFDEADYTAISRKELSEVFDIFQAFGLQMRPLEAPHEGQRMEIE